VNDTRDTSLLGNVRRATLFTTRTDSGNHRRLKELERRGLVRSLGPRTEAFAITDAGREHLEREGAA